MVADNKQPSYNTETTPSAKVGDGGSRSPHTFKLKKLSKRNLILLSFIAIVIVVLGWVVIHNTLHIGQKVYAQAAGHKIYKNDIDNLIGGNKGISQRNAATALADKYLTQAMAKDLKVKVTDRDIETAYGSSIETQKKQNKYQYQFNVNKLYFAKLEAQEQGDYKGELLIANFSRNVPFQSGRLPEQKAINPNIGNPAAIAADKKYAQDLINNLYKQIKAGKITFEQAIQIEQSDPVVGARAYGGQLHSGPFNTASQYQIRNGIIQFSSVKSQIRNIKQGQTSKPFVVRVSDSVDTNSTAEAYFLVVHMDSVSGGQSGISFEQYFSQAKKNLGYKIYV